MHPCSMNSIKREKSKNKAGKLLSIPSLHEKRIEDDDDDICGNRLNYLKKIVKINKFWNNKISKVN